MSLHWHKAPLAALPARSVAHVAFYLHDLSGGGVERMRLELIARLLAAGLQVTLLLHQDGGELRDAVPAGARVIRFATSRTLADVGALSRFMAQARPDVLVASLDHNNIAALIARAVGRHRTLVIACQHNALSREAAEIGLKYRAVPYAYRLLAPFAAGFVAVSHGVAEDLAAVTGIHPRRIDIIHNPVIGLDFLQRVDAPADHPWLAERGIPLIVSAGRLVAQKDHATLLDAFARLSRRRRARLLLLGAGPLRAALQAQARSLGIAGDVDLPGFVANPLPYMRAARVFALSSRHEGFGNVLVEALACGTPVVATDCPHGPAEILRGGSLGRLVPVGDPAALAEALWRSLNYPPPPAMLRRRAEDFSTERAAEAWVALFGRLIAKRGAQGGTARGAERAA
jgi:glycosyltransferase involved in cell wall biosynthesis